MMMASEEHNLFLLALLRTKPFGYGINFRVQPRKENNGMASYIF
jgi:hypothetical protein